MIILNEGSISSTINNLANDYNNRLSKKLTGNLGKLYKATSEEIKANPDLEKLTKEFDEVRAPYQVEISPSDNKFKMTFDSTKVPTNLVDKFKPGGEYDKKVQYYDPKTRKVVMIYDVDPSRLPETDNQTRQGTNRQRESFKEALEMTPPETYHDEESDEYFLRTKLNGKTYDYVMKDGSPYTVDQMLQKVTKMMSFSQGKALAFLKKNMTLKSNPVLEIKTVGALSEMKNTSRHKYTDVVTVDGKKVINSQLASEHKEYYDTFIGYVYFELEDGTSRYYPVDLSGKLVDDPEAWSFIKKQGLPQLTFRSGKSSRSALKTKVRGTSPNLKESRSISRQGLKDQLTKELNKVMTSPDFGYDEDEARQYSGVEVSEDQGSVVVNVWAEVDYDSLWTIMGALDPIIAKYDKEAYFDMEDSGRLSATLQDVKLKESRNPFKSHFICQGCGKPLNQCTCEIKEEDIDLSSLDESATQSSSIGQHKFDSIDLLEPKEALNLDFDSRRLKKLISSLVVDSDDELREFVNAIVDEVIEERSQKESVHKEALDDYNPDDKWHTVAQYSKELNSIDPKYNDVRLSDDEFHDMYELGYTLGTSNSGAFTSAKKSDYDQYKSGKDVNGDTIKRDSTGKIVRVSKRFQKESVSRSIVVFDKDSPNPKVGRVKVTYDGGTYRVFVNDEQHADLEDPEDVIHYLKWKKDFGKLSSEDIKSIVTPR